MATYDFNIHEEKFERDGDIYHINVIDDSHLPGGTKQRATRQYLKSVATAYDEIVYAGPRCGYAQVALAAACNEMGLRFMSYVNGILDGKDTDPMRLVKELGGTVREIYSHRKIKGKRVRCPGILKDVLVFAKLYADDSRFLVPFGLHDDIFRDILLRQLEYVKDYIPSDPETMWVVAGSGTLLSILRKVFPDTKFKVVAVGKTIWADQLTDRDTLYIATDKTKYKRNAKTYGFDKYWEDDDFESIEFWQEADDPPPFDSTPEYDAKVWRYVKKYASDGDYLWNVK